MPGQRFATNLLIKGKTAYTEQLQDIPIDLIEHCHLLRHESRVTIDDLIASFQKVGQLSPIRVRPHPGNPGKYQVIFGNRRLAAARLIGLKTIRSEVVEGTDLDCSIMAFVENQDRKDLIDFEKAVFLENLHKKTGKSYTEISELIGKSLTFVSLHISMLHLIPDNIAPIEEIELVLRSITEKHARLLARIEDLQERWSTAKLVVSAHIGTRELEKICNRYGRFSKEGRRKPRNNVRDVMNSIVAGLNSRNVQLSFASASDKDFTMFSRFPPFTKMDMRSAKDHIHNILKNVDHLKVKVEDLEVHFMRGAAYATLTVSQVISQYGEESKTKARATIILSKENGIWKIIHEHWSTAEVSEVKNPVDAGKSQVVSSYPAKRIR